MRRKLLMLLGAFLVIYLINFTIPRLMPGDPFDYVSSAAGDDGSVAYSEEQKELLRAYYGLDNPFWAQFWDTLWSNLHGDFGQSIHYHRPVGEVLLERLPWSLWIMGGSLAMSLVPAISAFSAKRYHAGIQDTARLGLKLALIIGLPCAVGLFVLASPILAMLYPNLTEGELTLAVDLMHTSSIGVIFLSLVQSMTGVIQGMGKPNVPVFNLFIGFVLKVASLLALMNIPQINIQGAAVSTVVCYAFAGIADTIYVIRRAKLRLGLVDVLLKPVLSSGVMGFVVFMIYSFMQDLEHQALSTLTAVAVGVFAYGVMAIYFRFFTREELAYIPGGQRIRKLMYGD